jgi:pimeloyl-ACP methyl ester carboxylesterase
MNVSDPIEGEEQHDINVKDLRVRYRSWGTGDPVIVLHGWPETSYEWRHVGPLLAAAGNWHVLAPDTRGHGNTAAPGSGYSRGQLAEDVVGFMDALGIERAPVIGHDWGGIIAFKVAVDHGDRVSRLALLDTITTGWPLFVDYYYWFMVPDLAEVFFAKHAEDFIRTIIGRRGAPPLPAPPACPFNMPPELLATREWADDSDVEAYAAPYRDAAEVAATCNYYRSLSFHRVIADDGATRGERYESVSHEEMAAAWLAGTAGGEYLDYGVEDRHKRYHGPALWMPSSGVLAAAGDDDPAMANFHRQFPNLIVSPIEAGHFICEEAPDQTAEVLAKFLTAG